MKAHSSNFKKEIKLLGRQIDAKLYYELDGEMIELSNEELNSVIPNFQGNILKSAMKELEFDASIDIPLETKIHFDFGILVNGKYEYINFGDYIVYSSEKQEDLQSYKIVAYDYMLRSMTTYNKLQTGTFPMTVREYLVHLCNDLSLEFVNENMLFANYDKILPNDLYAGLGYTYRDIFDELSQVTASTICIDKNNKVEVRYINNTNDVINEEFLKDVNVNFGEKYGPINSIVLSRSGESDNVYLQDEESVEENGLCEIKIIDNQIMNFNDRSDYLEDILNQLNGLEYYINDFKSTGICYLDLCDRYKVNIGNNEFDCIMFNDEINITQGLEEQIFTNMPIDSVTDYEKADKTDRKINQTYIIVDKQNQKIDSVVSDVDKQNDKISKISQTVDEINSKISDIADITTSGESSYATLDLSNINASEPIHIRIFPLNNNISYLYPNNGTYPSDNLYSKVRTLRFINTKTNEYFDYELPNDLLYFDEETFDEFVLDYDSTSCQIIKRCEYNEDGEVVKLSGTKTYNYEYPQINLTDGNYTISLLGYNNGYISVRLMASNIYTSQFATKVELSSAITQTSKNIMSEVSEKYYTKDETDKANRETRSLITQTASSITAEVSSQVNRLDSNINQTNDNVDRVEGKVELKLDESEYTPNKVVSKLNASADEINLRGGSRINLSTVGKLIISAGNFQLDASGNVIANNGTFNGIVNATSGTFNGDIVTNNAIINGGTLTLGNSSSANPRIRSANTNSDGTQNTSYLYGNGLRTILGGSTLVNLRHYKTGNYYYGTLTLNNTESSDSCVINSFGVHQSSDIRLKTNIKNIDQQQSIDFINSLTPIEYTFKGSKTFRRGLSAQEVEEKNKKLNLKSSLYEYDVDEDKYMLNYTNFIPDLINCIKYQQKEIEELKEEIKSLKESEK